MTQSNSKQSKLVLLLLSMALTVSFTSCASVVWEEPNSADSPLVLNAGTYCLPITVLADTMFPYPIHLVSNDSRFTWQNGFYMTYQATYANDIMGSAANLAAGLYVINFTLDNPAWTGPGLLYVQVTKTPVELTVDQIVTISSGSAQGSSFNLVSLSPYADITISASVSSNEFTVSPSSVTFRPNATAQGFTLSTNGNTKSTSSATVTYTLSGSNAASYTFNQTTQVVRVPGGSSTSTATTTTTTSPTTNTSTSTTPTTTTTTSPTTNTTSNTSTTTTTTPTTTSTNTTTTTTTPTTTTKTPTTTTTTTTPTTTTSTTTSSGKLTLTSSASNLSVIAGTHSLPFTLTTSDSTFKSSVWCTTTTNGFRMNPQLVATAGTTSAKAYLGADGNLAPGNYTVGFWCNNTNYPAPPSVKVQVTSGQVKIPKPATVTVSYTPGTLVSSSNVTFDLSAYAPWSDITITPKLPAGESRLLVFPSVFTISAASKTASFVYQTWYTASGNFTANVSFVISGTNGASYAVNGTQTVNAVAKTRRLLSEINAARRR